MRIKQIKPTTEEEKGRILDFIEFGYFEIIKQGDYKFFGVKKGYLKQLKVYYSLKEIKILLNRIEELINFGAICEDCLSFCEFWEEEQTNANGFKCLNCGEMA